MTGARVVTVTLADGQQVNVWLFDSGEVDVSWRPEAGDRWLPVELAGGSVLCEEQAA